MKGVRLRSLAALSSLAILRAPVPSHAVIPRDGSSLTRPGGLGTVLEVGFLAISIDRVTVTTCMRPPHGRAATPIRPGWEWLYTEWDLRNPGNHPFSLPHPNHPGFRLVAAHHLFPGFYASYPGYSSLIPSRASIVIPWKFAIRRGTKRVSLTYLPPGPSTVLWSIAIPKPSAEIDCR